MQIPMADNVSSIIVDDIKIIFHPALVDDLRALACVKKRALFDISC